MAKYLYSLRHQNSVESGNMLLLCSIIQKRAKLLLVRIFTLANCSFSHYLTRLHHCSDLSDQTSLKNCPDLTLSCERGAMFCQGGSCLIHLSHGSDLDCSGTVRVRSCTDSFSSQLEARLLTAAGRGRDRRG